MNNITLYLWRKTSSLTVQLRWAINRTYRTQSFVKYTECIKNNIKPKVPSLTYLGRELRGCTPPPPIRSENLPPPPPQVILVIGGNPIPDRISDKKSHERLHPSLKIPRSAYELCALMNNNKWKLISSCFHCLSCIFIPVAMKYCLIST